MDNQNQILRARGLRAAPFGYRETPLSGPLSQSTAAEGDRCFHFFFFSDGTIILLPHPGTKVIVDAVTFSLPSFCPASRCGTLSSG